MERQRSAVACSCRARRQLESSDALVSLRPSAVVVLAAGVGTRMVSATPKVLHEVGGRSLVGHVIAAASSLQPEHLVVVVGHGREQVAAHLADDRAGRRRGRAGAAERHRPRRARRARRARGGRRRARRRPAARGRRRHARCSPARPSRALVDTHVNAGAALDGAHRGARRPHRLRPRAARRRTATSSRSSSRRTPTTRSARCARSTAASTPSTSAALADALGRLTTDNAQGEEYLTDVIGSARRRPASSVAAVVAADDATRSLGVNDRVAARRGPRAAARPRQRSAGCAPASRSSTRRPRGSTSTCVLEPDCRDRAQHQPARAHHRRRAARSSAPTPRSPTSWSARARASCAARSRQAEIGAGRHGRPVHLPAARHRCSARGPSSARSSRPRTP